MAASGIPDKSKCREQLGLYLIDEYRGRWAKVYLAGAGDAAGTCGWLAFCGAFRV